MTVLIDLHGAPGSQNGQDHSGKSGEILWPSSSNIALTVNVLETMSSLWSSIPNVWGFELLNEPHYSISHDVLTNFYRDAYSAIRKYSDDTHVVINSLYVSVIYEPCFVHFLSADFNDLFVIYPFIHQFATTFFSRVPMTGQPMCFQNRSIETQYSTCICTLCGAGLALLTLNNITTRPYVGVLRSGT